MEPTHPLSLAGSSRVISVAALRRLGADLPVGPEMNDDLLAEVRPHPTFDPSERAELQSRGVRRFVATIENERTVVEVDLENTDAWFLELIPLRTLANIPNDASALFPLSATAQWKPEVVRGYATALMRAWVAGRNPKLKTREFLTSITVAEVPLATVLQPALRLLSRKNPAHLNKHQRNVVVTALELIIQSTGSQADDKE